MASGAPARPRSANVTTSTTPGCVAGARGVHATMRAWACGLRRTHDVQHAGQRDVAHVAPAPGEQARVFLAQMPVADELHAATSRPAQDRRRIERGEHDVLVARAAAEVARQRLADVRLGRLGMLAQICRRAS